MKEEARTFSESQIQDSCLHWIGYFVDVCDRVGFDVRSIEPNPLLIMREVLSKRRPLCDLDLPRSDWVRQLKASPMYLDTGAVELLPLRLAVEVASVRFKNLSSIEQTKSDIERYGELIDIAMSRLGYNIHTYDDIWDSYYSNWVKHYLDM